MRLVFMGTPDFAVPILKALLAADHKVERVYTQPPRPAGRGKSLRQSAVHTAAIEAGIDVETPKRFREPEVIDGFAELKPDAAIVVAYGQILPQLALDVPRLGCLNLHASLLPRWRGAAPIQRAVMAGDRETGVGVMQMDAGLDTGPILAEAKTEIGSDDTAATLHDRLAEIGAPLMVETLAALDRGQVEPRSQTESGATYAAKIDKAEARIDWTESAEAIDCKIRGLAPFPGAWSELGDQRLKLLMSKLEDASGRPGEVLDENLLIACGSKAVRLTRLQRAGKSVSDASDFLQGFPIALGTAFT